MRFILSLCTALLAAMPLVAQESSSLKALNTLEATKGWQGVGRLNIGTTGFCTGTLIAPDLVLTAAHCLFDTKSGARAKDDSIKFLAGWQGGRASAYRGVRQTVVHASYQHRSREEDQRVGADIALLQLDQPIRHPSIKPFHAGPRVGRGHELKVVSYARNRADAPSLQDTCHVLAKDQGVYVTSCDVDFGSSGAPVFVEQDGRAVISSIVSAKAEWDTRPVSITVGVDGPLSDLMGQLSARASTAPTGGKRLVFQSGMQPSGARFVKP